MRLFPIILLFLTACEPQSDTTTSTDQDGDQFPQYLDCDDTNPDVYPDAPEACNGLDDDCDGHVDELVLTTFYADTDGDGFGDVSDTIEACAQPDGHVDDDTDCDDTDPGTFPGADEVCDGVDNDCNGAVDEDAVDAPTWYADTDGDGFGDSTVAVASCTVAQGFVETPGDCNDSDLLIHPDAPDTCYDDVDQDCDGHTDLAWSWIDSIRVIQDQQLDDSVDTGADGEPATISLWVRPTDTQDTWSTVFQHGDTRSDRRPAFYIEPSSTTLSVNWASEGDSKNEIFDVGGELDLRLDTWHHVALVTGGDDLSLYLDGTEVAARDTDGLRLGGVAPFWVKGPFADTPANASIANVRYYCTAQTAGEIQGDMDEDCDSFVNPCGSR